MSTSNFDSFGSPSQKRFRPENELPPDSSGSEDPGHHNEFGQISPEIVFRAKKLRPFNALNNQDECVVGDVGGNTRRHLCSSPQYATAAVTHTNESELLNNGDSGFQELNIPDDSLDMNENMTNNENAINIGSDGSPLADMANSNKKSYEDDDSISEFSCASDISNLSGEDWKPISNHIKWVHLQMEKGTNPKEIVRELTGNVLPDEIDDISAWRFIVRLLSESSVTCRSKLNHINTIEDVISLIQNSSKIIVLTGAGVSVSCGIPDFRSRNGIYARLSKDYPDLPDPQSMFDIHYFRKNPYPFFKFAKEIYPGQFLPSPSHNFIKYIELKGKLLRNYSQNIDTLEKAAGIEKVIACHGSFATATCTNCGFKVDSNAIKSDIFAQRIPLCQKCTTDNAADSSIISVMKPDIVFFGEGLSDEFHTSMTIDKDECDLLIVIGSSLKVRPVALIPNSIPEDIPQILINREPLSHLNFDVELLGDCDIIIEHLCERLGQDWTDFCFLKSSKNIKMAIKENENDECAFQSASPSRYIFKGAELNDLSLDNNEDSDSSDEGSESELEDENNVNNLNTSECRDISEESTSQMSNSVDSSSSNLCFAKINIREDEKFSSNARENNIAPKSEISQPVLATHYSSGIN